MSIMSITHVADQLVDPRIEQAFTRPPSSSPSQASPLTMSAPLPGSLPASQRLPALSASIDFADAPEVLPTGSRTDSPTAATSRAILSSVDAGQLVVSEARPYRHMPRTASTPDALPPVITLLNQILLDAALLESSDLHFERGEHDLRIRFRVDGILHTRTAPPLHLRDALIARIKSLAGLDIAERRLPQDGRLTIRITPHQVEDFRVSTLPTVHGEKVVLRRLDTLAPGVDLSMLGLAPAQQTQVTEALAAPHGMMLVTGPTGSGKTLSLFCLLQMLNTPGMNVCTVEDPVEIRLPGLTQVSVQQKAGLTFASVLRAFLRQDPDVLMVGEIRDAETADIAVKAAQTGHRVLSTLHTNDAPSTVTRLRDIGIAPYRLASSLTLITAQRLIRRLCPACRRPDPLDAHAWVANLRGDCSQCHGIGYRGRIGVHQLMPITEGLRHVIASDQGPVALHRLAREEGMLSLHEAALAFVQDGQTSLAEAAQLEDRRL